MDSAHDAWLHRNVEEVLEPEMPICDPHHHLWDYPTDRYLLDELRADTGDGHHVVSTVFVECMSGYRVGGPEELRPVGETEMVKMIADQSAATTAHGAVIAGIVGFADLRGTNVDEVLATHEAAGAGRFRGIRHASASDPDPALESAHTSPPPQLFADPEFRKGFAALGAAGLSFDAWLYHPQIPELTDLARAHPEVIVVLDHLGGPVGIGPYAGRRDEVMDAWRTSMADLATCPNVNVKLGGIGMPIFGLGFHKRPDPPSSQQLVEVWGPHIRWCIETFGAERCMFESNFPVDKASCSYRTLWNAFKQMTAADPPAARRALFQDTAVRVYRLGS